ncbi:hypothetical protein BO71DRAFT_448281 [Aspergillus ellipticus CBS 707.79]|uniref:Aminoglycoside phosphotransferase domain-containing protein n=1 Tax=Aspergillus ellipticus CBS 707.79 TaxID=1448320 RepID=A0A319DI00_9EURO|nr:hypothetical protein BO71DRAFT_448281 [Aspergillus ellipticus CBS 707.79]
MTASDTSLSPPLSPDSITELILSLDLPTPSQIEPLQVSAAFHSIYLIHFDPSTAPSNSPTLVLRVSGPHLPSIKTLNEVGIMTWIRQSTQIPIPEIIRYSATSNNPIGHEFTLLTRAQGTSIDKIYDTLSTYQKTLLVEQLTDHLIELHSHPFTPSYVGGLTLQNNNPIPVPGPPIDETFWQTPDITKYWTSSETLSSLNPANPTGYANYTSYNTACMERYIHAIATHPSLSAYRDLIPRFHAFIAALSSPDHVDELNDVKYVLAHKDLHFANIMCDPADPDCRITAILDWEFSGVVPVPRWNPPRAFLWNMKWSEEDKAEQTRMEGVFEEVCQRKGAGGMLEEMKLNGKQEVMQRVVNHVRAIVEVCPRGQAAEKVGGWRRVVEEGMGVFGV